MKRLFSFLAILLTLYPVLAQEVITPIPEKKGALTQVMSFMTKYGFWVIGIIIVAIIAIFVVTLIKRLKKKIDPFLEDYKRIRGLCKFHRDPTIKSVILVNELEIKSMGKYLGQCIDSEGYLNILLWKFKKWWLFFFPIKFDFFDIVKEEFIIRCNLNKTFKFKTKDEKTGEETIEEVDLPYNIAIKNEDKILIKGFGIERVRYFFYPLLKDKKGNIANSKLDIFIKERDSSLINVLYAQVEDFANVSRELINLNPYARWKVKTGEPAGEKGGST